MKKTSSAYSILVVDDEVELCDAVSTAFKMKGHSVLQASNGTKALENIKAHKFDLVLSDVRMNEGDGIQLLNFIKDMNINRPVVALMTGFADVTRDEMYEMGAEAVFEKPFKVMELIRQLTKTLETKEQKWGEKPNVIPVAKIKMDVTPTKNFNLGRGGFCITPESGEFKNNQLVEFDLGFTEGFKDQRLRGQGFVRWVRAEQRASYGIEFIYLEEPMRTQVVKMIEKLNARTYIPKG